MTIPKISSLVAQQLPEFIRNDHTTFVAFIEAYYAWMEESGNVLERSGRLLESLNIDTTLTEFIDYFCNQFLTGIPQYLLNDKALLIAHAKELYRTKGTQNSFKLLFRLLYGEEISITYPKDVILRVSDGKWIKQKSLRLDPTLWTTETANGSNTEFRTLSTYDDIGDVSVYVNGVLQTTGYFVSRNRPYVVFTNAPANGAIVKITYDAFTILGLFNTNQVILSITGDTSGATAISETAERLIIDGIELFNLNVSAVTGTFHTAETISGVFTYDLDSLATLTVRGTLASLISSIEVIDGGANYNVGDYVPVVGGDPTITANAVVDSIYTAVITNISVLNGGCGYQAGQSGYLISTPNTGLSVAIASVDVSAYYHPNSYPLVTDVVNLYSTLAMDNANYGFLTTGNANTVLSNLISTYIFGGSGPAGLGPITNVAILLSTQTYVTSPTIRFDAPVATVTANSNTANATANVSIGYFGILGRMNVVSGGSNYQVGDELVFTNVPGIGIGVGAAAEVTEVHSANLGIKKITFQPSRVTGTVNASANIVIGTGTSFTTELFANDHIEINNESSYVQTITNNTHLIVNTNFTRTSTGRKLGVYGRYFIGGINYSMNALPTITVSSANAFATGANILAEGVISGGERLQTEAGNTLPGQIRAIRIVNPGYGYESLPIIDLTDIGNGQATAVAVLLSNLFISEGHYTNQDGMVSSDRKIQGVGTYYQQHAYVIRSRVELTRYKNILKTLLHPAGMQLFGEFIYDQTLRAANTSIASNITLTTP